MKPMQTGTCPLLTVAPVDPASPDALALMEELSATLAQITGDSGKASFDPNDVRNSAQARFVMARDSGGRAVGCGAFRPLHEGVAELKRMYARPGTTGVGAAVLAYLEAQAQTLGYQALWLETRLVNQRAVSFYERKGYARIPNFGKYVGLEGAVCFEKRLAAAGAAKPAGGGRVMGAALLTHRLAGRDDLEPLKALMDAAISELQKPFLDASQIASSRMLMGLDSQLIDDGTYFIVEAEGELAGCGGWSRRATLYGGDQSPGRSAALLDPAKDAARVRAMYTHPRHTRKGVGRLILSLCEGAARAEGFKRAELMATRAGEPLYRACGYAPGEAVIDDRGGAPVPLVRMGKAL
jgi:GNAT superfamily N-acetyltransferase